MSHNKIHLLLTLSVFLIVFSTISSEARRKQRRSKGWSEDHPVPYVEVINSTTVLLLKIPTRGSKPNCPLVKYTVKVREERTNYVMTRHIQGVTDQLTIRYLDPNSNYSIRIIPRDCVGRSWISNWIFFTTAYPPIPEPARLTKTQAFSNSIFVSWSPPSGGVAVQGYVVGYGEGVPEVNWQYLEGNRTNMTIKNLKKNTQYVVSVRAYNSAGKGPAVYEVVQTKDDVPDLSPPPPLLEAKVMSATSIGLRWTDPSLPSSLKLPEDNRYYSVQYKYQHPHEGKLIEKTEISKKLEMVLTRLHANTEYQIRVRTVRDSQIGAYSLPATERTLEAAPPQPPRSVSISVIQADALNRSVDVLVTWKPPKLTNGNITSYLVQYTDNLELSGDVWKAITVAGRTEVVISDLVYGGAYYFRVQAKNSQGFGPKTFILKMYAVPRNDQSPALLKAVHTVGNKTKRDQSLDSPEEEGDNSFNDQTPPHVDFKVMLQVKINGFITWPERHPSSECGNEVAVSSYKFLYHKVGEANWSAVELNVNMYVMENLELNTVYEYKVAYVNEEASVWTKLHQLSTSPDQHEPID